MLSRWLFLIAVPLLAQDSKATLAKAVIKDEAGKKILVGEHRLTLQWLDKATGKVVVTDTNGALAIRGEAKDPPGTGLVRVEGVITEVDAKSFQMRGTIVTQVTYINNGKPCERKGDFHFLIKGPRAFWRMQEINNPCDEAADYVDIYWK